jgi:hypothetical protein
MKLAAIIIGSISAVVSGFTLIFLFARGVSIERRLTTLETQMDPLWNALKTNVSDWLQGLNPPGNPITSERWQGLLQKFQDNTITPAEALELNDAMVEQQEEARRTDDRTSLLALGIGLALLSVVLLGN